MKNRELTSIEQLFAYSPYSLVGVIARIKGEISEDSVKDAISRVRKKHPVLQCRIVNDGAGSFRFEPEEAGAEILFESVPRHSSQQWIHVLEERSKVPFNFEKQAPIRFILIKSPEVSELLILCHHIICDGVSITFFTRDLLRAMGNPDMEFEPPSDPIPISFDNLPSDVSTNFLVRYIINRMNKKWEKQKVIFHQEDYVALNQAYWSRFHHKTACIELSESETTQLVRRCKENHVSVNSALTAAFVGAQVVVQGYQPAHASIGIAADVRARLPVHPGESLGFYAGMTRLKIKYNPNKGFWDNARQFQEKMKPKFTNKLLFSDFLSWLYLHPSIITAINFKKFGGLTNNGSPSGKKLQRFSENKDVVKSIMRRDNMDSFTHKLLGTAVTNLTKLDFPRTYGNLELDRLIIHPGGAFPLSNVNLVIGAVTCSGKLTLIVEYEGKTMSNDIVDEVKEKAMRFLSDHS